MTKPAKFCFLVPWLRRFTVLLGICALGLRAADPAPAPVSVEETFKRALFEEEGRRNYEAAVRGYEEVVRAMDEQRRLAATAVFRLAECYRKLARTNDAVAQYRRVLRDFADEETLAKLGRENLAALGARPIQESPTPGAAGGTSPERRPGDPSMAAEGRASGDVARREAELVQEASLLESQLETLRPLAGTQLQVALQTMFPGPAAGIARLRDQIDANGLAVVRLLTRFSNEHPEVHTAQREQAVLERRLDEEVANVMGGLETRLKALRMAVKRLHDNEELSLARKLKQEADQASGTNEEAEEIRRIQGLVTNSPDLINALVNGVTPLQVAATKGQIAVMRHLLDHGARVDVPSAQGNTALHSAAESGHKAAVELLLERHAAVDAKGAQGVRPLHLAAARGFLAICELLLAKGADLRGMSEASETPLHAAARAGHAEVVRFLLDHGADPNLRVSTGPVTLTLARSVEMVRLLLARQADPNLDGGARLRRAIESREIEVVEALLAAGANPNGPEGTREPLPLRVALLNRDTRDRRITDLLMKHGGDLNHLQHPPGVAVLHGLAEDPRTDAEWLAWALEHGADPNLKNSDGKTALELLGPGLPLSRTRKPGEDRGDSDPEAEMNRFATRWAKLLVLLRGGADPRLPLTDGYPLVHHLVVWASAQELQALKEFKPDLSAPGAHGATPLMVAAVRGNVAAVAWLIEQGVDVQAADENGFTALQVAALFERKEIVGRLREAKADPAAKNRFGLSALDFVRGVAGPTFEWDQLGMPVLGKQQSSLRLPTTPPPRQLTLQQEELLKLLGATP